MGFKSGNWWTDGLLKVGTGALINSWTLATDTLMDSLCFWRTEYHLFNTSIWAGAKETYWGLWMNPDWTDVHAQIENYTYSKACFCHFFVQFKEMIVDEHWHSQSFRDTNTVFVIISHQWKWKQLFSFIYPAKWDVTEMLAEICTDCISQFKGIISSVFTTNQAYFLQLLPRVWQVATGFTEHGISGLLLPIPWSHLLQSGTTEKSMRSWKRTTKKKPKQWARPEKVHGVIALPRCDVHAAAALLPLAETSPTPILSSQLLFSTVCFITFFFFLNP